MFALVNVSACGMDGDTYAWDLLEHGVSVMPGSAFGESLTDWVRVALTIDDERFAKALDRIVAHANLSDRNVA
jgi:arginine:pyruvate transaminase